MKKIRYYLLLIALLISSNIFAQSSELINVIVGNEGNFGTGNATITNYILENSTATDGVFLSANGSGLGDIVQSVQWINGKFYIVVNNSQKIVIADPSNFMQTGQISFGEGSSPREIVKVSDTKAYVTDLFGSAVYSVNLENLTVAETTIGVGKNPDRIITHNGFAYVANNGFGSDSTIFKIDISSDAVVDTFIVSRGPAGMVVDTENTLWVVCTGYSGDFDDDFNIVPGTSRPGGLYGIDLNTGSTVAFSELASADSDIALDEEDEVIFINSGGVRVFNLENNTFSPDTLIPGFFYAMGYEKISNSLYLADAKDFSSAGEVNIYTNSGVQTGSFDTGIIPGSFLYVYNDMIGTNTESNESIRSFTLAQNYPNPFNPSTNIEFSLQQSGNIKLEVFNATGQIVAELVNGFYTSGAHFVAFDASQLSSGIYIYRIVTEQGSISKKMILIK
ncbi:MAG: hypothetical protein BalsKO_05110 [Balneolaceae bacterium]